MFPYPTYPYLWSPQENPEMLTVKVPQEYIHLTDRIYRTLMEERLSWLIWEAMTTEGHSLTDIHQTLSQFLSQTAPTQMPPNLPDNLEDQDDTIQWCQDWAQTLVQGNEIVRIALNTADLTIPTLTPDSSLYSSGLDLHNSTTLLTWLDTVKP